MIDEFYNDQPPLLFIDALRAPLHTKRPEGFGARQKKAGETDANGIYIDTAFSDPEGLLDTAYADFKLFCNIYGISGNRFPIKIEYAFR